MLLGDTDTAPGGRGARTYAYDPLYQVTSATATEGGAPVTRQYGYVDDYKLGQYGEADVLLDYTDAAHPDRAAGLTPPGGARTALGYDANGNLTSLPAKTMAYNAKNELAHFETAAGLVAEYRYDHQGIRVSKTLQNGGALPARTLFVKDLVEIRDGVPAYFVRLGHLRVAIHRQGTTRFVHADPLGGTAFFTDAAGTKIAAIAYRPFGNVATSSGTLDFRTYGTHPFDEESGFSYFLRRTYAPEIGRFLTPDPLAVYEPETQLHNPKALHPYVFTGNDPLNKVDEDGFSFWSVVGAIVGVIAAIAVAAVVVLTGGLAGVLIGIALAVALVSVSYVVASATAGTGFGEFMRGFMIGFNAGLNAIIATALFGPVVGIALGVVNFLAAFDTIAGNSFYQGVLGWSSWLMPMSWLATAVGLVFFLLTVIPAIFTLNQVPAVAIDSISIDWGTGSIVTTGGWMFLPGFRGGYNLGNFTYITPGSTVAAHEAGHVLNVAAFGSIFHFVGAIDENVPPFARGPGAYAERLAESHDPTGAVPPWAEMWR
ncbi:MAG: RHS repeat-associated core domain-containing protein [Chloroflexia bacterium]|nr:RHS repeat-associated core domain-containing protein [Chloroflexia bacterium]